VLITQTPLRVSFFGGGTDMAGFYKRHDGEVLSTAIRKYVYVIVKERYDSDIVINYTKKEIVQHVDDVEHELVREALRKVGISGGLEITTLADIPAHGSGLGSSSAVTVGVLNALYGYTGQLVSAERLARDACEIEIDLLEHPIGKQDQYITAHGDFRHIRFQRDGTVQLARVPLTQAVRDHLSAHLLLFYTGIQRRSREILAEQKKMLDERMEHTLALKGLVPQALRILEDISIYGSDKAPIIEFGRLLNKGWQLKCELASTITSDEIDDMYDTAIKAGAAGGKLLGAGGGGFLLLCVPGDRKNDVRRALHHLQEFPLDFARDGTKTIFNMQAT